VLKTCDDKLLKAFSPLVPAELNALYICYIVVPEVLKDLLKLYIFTVFNLALKAFFKASSTFFAYVFILVSIVVADAASVLFIFITSLIFNF